MGQQVETRPVMFITYAYDDPDEAPVIDSSGTLEEARRNRREAGYGFTYRVTKIRDGEYGDEHFVESE